LSAPPKDVEATSVFAAADVAFTSVATSGGVAAAALKAFVRKSAGTKAAEGDVMTIRRDRKTRSALIPALLAPLLIASAGQAAPTAPAAPPLPTPPAASAVATPGRWEAAAPPSAKEKDKQKDGCRDVITQNPTLDGALRALTFEGAGGRHPLAGVKIVGLKTLDEKALWTALGGQPPVIDSAEAAAVLRQLAGLGVFASLTPVIDVRGDAGPTLIITVVEHPTIRKVVIEGLGEQKPEELLRALLEAPSRKDAERSEKRLAKKLIARASAELEKAGIDQPFGPDGPNGPSGKDDKIPVCPDPLPSRDWLARSEDQVVFPGIVWKGLPRGLGRMLGRLYDKGYQMATLAADLGADGTLTIRIDEGRIAKVDVAGVEPRIQERVRALVGIEAGKPFVKSDLDGAFDRIKTEFPFLRTDSSERASRPRPRIVESAGQGGAAHFQSAEEPAKSNSRWFTVNDGQVVLYFRARRWQGGGDPSEIIRHTPVTSFAPGIEMTGRMWDPADLVHLRVDLGANVNTSRARAADSILTFPNATCYGVRQVDCVESQGWRFDWSGAVSAQVPTLRLAEFGINGYARVDTADRWRINRVDSYINSILFNRPDSDYFRRTGFTAFMTFHFLERLTAGIEYRRDGYRSLATVSHFTLFNRDEESADAVRAYLPLTPAVTQGKMGSLLLRLEWSSERAPLGQFGTLRRDAERSIVDRPNSRASWAELRTMNTLEIADPGLGGDDAFKFVRLVSDSAVFVRTGHKQGLKIRFRAAGKLGEHDLPLQKQEAIGGWSAVRGYGFKELRGGQFSLLGTAEYRMDALSAFVDIGSLRTDGAFGNAKTGAGLALNFSDKVHLDFAWRADDQATWRPAIRLLFHRTY
jgi:hypothetical protein